MIKQATSGDRTHVTFVLPDKGLPGKVSVVGDFNDWTPGVHTLVRRSNGTRSIKVTLDSGATYAFRYLAEGGRWLDDPEVQQRDARNGLILT